MVVEILFKHGPLTISGKLTDQSYTGKNWLLFQDITILRPDGSMEDYSLFCHPRVPIGRNCSFVFSLGAKLFFRLRCRLREERLSVTLGPPQRVASKSLLPAVDRARM